MAKRLPPLFPGRIRGVEVCAISALCALCVEVCALSAFRVVLCLKSGQVSGFFAEPWRWQGIDAVEPHGHIESLPRKNQ
jgi:hypothetical protein